MNINSLFNRYLWAIIFAGIAGYLIFRQFRKKNQLEQHAIEEKLLSRIGESVGIVDNLALEQYPLSTIGLEPLVGIEYDPFNPDSIASQPHDLELSPSAPSKVNYDDSLRKVLGITDNPTLRAFQFGW